jgi:hypothetical protein
MRLQSRGSRINLLAIHKSDPVVGELQVPELPAQSSAA